MKIAVIGTGYVGLVSAACFAEVGHDCTCVDLDAAKVARINGGEAPIHEPGLPELLARHRGTRLRATTDLAAAVRDAEITFIAVGTPFDGGRIDLAQVEAAAEQIGAALRAARPGHVVVVKSTVVPGTTDRVVAPALERASGLRAGVDFGVGMNPEFLTEGVAVRDFMQPDRIVVGGDALAVAAQRRVYEAFAGVPVIETGNATAEMIKYASNSVLATMISFSNEIANLCDAIGGVDVADVMRGVHAARYFTVPGPDGPVRAPITSFLWAGCGYGGSCLPKDTQALVAHAIAHGTTMPLLQAVIDTNAARSERMLELLGQGLPSLPGRRVAVLGLAFKEDTDDVRESPALRLIPRLLEAGAKVTAHDPIAVANARAALGAAPVTFTDRLEDAIAGQEALLLVTRWRDYERLPALLAGRTPQPLIVDGRRLLDRASVARYAGIGAGQAPRAAEELR